MQQIAAGPVVRSILLLAMILMTVSCSDDPAPPDRQDSGTISIDAAPDLSTGSCLPGATQEDCDLCTYGRQSCTRACPKVDCNVYPTPPECAGLCGTQACCTCKREIGNEYWWRPAPVTGKSKDQAACDDLEARWKAIVARPEIRRCARTEDCSAASSASCPYSSSVIDRQGGTGVNTAAYQATEGPQLELEYYQLKCGLMLADAAPPLVECVSGVCRTSFRSCLSRDAGL